MIYLVDDDSEVRFGFSMLFRSAGLECSVFESAEEFLNCVGVQINGILILDMELTGMNGVALLENMTMKGMYIPVIVVTAFDNPTYRVKCTNYGVIDYLLKPVGTELLLSTIRNNYS